jgi:predicted nucleotidyltransferase
VPLPSTLSVSERRAIEEFMAAARAMLGAELMSARLFGSRARREGHQYSDIDLALLVTSDGRKRRHEVYDLAFDIGLQHGVELAPLVIEHARLRELEARERLIAHDIAVEGIPV